MANEIVGITLNGTDYDYRDERIGDLSSLDTTEKTSIVGAINEVAASGGSEIKTFDLSSSVVITGKDNVLTVEPTFKMRSDGLILASIRLDGCTVNFNATGFFNVLSFSAKIPLTAIQAIPELEELLNDRVSGYTQFHASDFSTALCSPGAEGLVAFDFSGSIQPPAGGYVNTIQFGLSTFIAQVWSAGMGSGVGGTAIFPAMWF